LLSSSLPHDAALAAADGILSTVFDGEVVLLNQADGVYYGLRDVGARVWTLIQHTASLAHIRDTIAAEYDVDAARCATDVERLVADLVARGLVIVTRS
jgi:hypothetical protein